MYRPDDFECPDEKRSFLGRGQAHLEAQVLHIFRVAWVCKELNKPYFSITPYTEHEQAGLLELVEAPSTYRLTQHALSLLHKVYGRR